MGVPYLHVTPIVKSTGITRTSFINDIGTLSTELKYTKLNDDYSTLYIRVTASPQIGSETLLYVKLLINILSEKNFYGCQIPRT